MGDVDWLNGKLTVERGIVEHNVDDVKTNESRKSLTIAANARSAETVEADNSILLTRGLDFRFPTQLGRLPWSYDQIWRMYQKGRR